MFPISVARRWSVAALLVAAAMPLALASGASAVAAASCQPGSAACPIVIRFGTGDWSGQAGSRLAGVTDERWFSLDARAGQTMVVVVEGAGPTRGVVVAPGGSQGGMPGGRVFDQMLSTSGTYRIRATEDSMAQAWSGPVEVVALIY